MNYNKISPGLLLALQEYQEQGDTGLVETRSLGIASSVEGSKPTRVVAFIYCAPTADLSHLEAQGVRLNQSLGAIRTAIFPLDSLEAVSNDPAVIRVKPSRYLNSTMDTAAPKVKLPQFQSKNPSLTGKGVVVGIVDSGIDPNHPAFAGRILRIWDQTISGPGVAEGGYGLELSGPTLSASRDVDGHGTHVAGIAAGKDGAFAGVAPEADIVMVKTDFQDAHIADGIRYIFGIASELGRPAVVNLSLGGHFDSHDGKDSLSMSVDELSGEGRVVVIAAGNEGNDNIHGATTVAPGAIATMRFLVPNNAARFALLNGWYNGALEVSLRTPSNLVTPYQKIITGNTDPTKTYNLPDGRIDVITPGADPSNGDVNFFVQIRPGRMARTVKGGVWQLRVKNTGTTPVKLDVWSQDGQPATQVVFTGQSVQDNTKVGSPGAAAKAITVAAYTTRSQYKDLDGNAREVGLTVDTIADFSSEGPLRNGAQKPDVAAPGAMIVSAASGDAQNSRASLTSDKYVVNAGTSMACPYVAGVVALMLQRNPKLTPEEAKQMLKANSAVPGKPAGTFDNKWGYGLINLENL
jgi:subtilisin family serine protease